MTKIYELSVNGGLRPSESAEMPQSGELDGIAQWIRMVGTSHQEWQSGFRALGLSNTPSEVSKVDDMQSSVVICDLALLVMTLPVLARESPLIEWAFRLGGKPDFTGKL
jgi:hypothetical protein